jgi:hypothetical protein
MSKKHNDEREAEELAERLTREVIEEVVVGLPPQRAPSATPRVAIILGPDEEPVVGEEEPDVALPPPQARVPSDQRAKIRESTVRVTIGERTVLETTLSKIHPVELVAFINTYVADPLATACTIEVRWTPPLVEVPT